MEIKKHYFIIPLVVILVAVGGWILTKIGMDWYLMEVVKPDFTPQGWVISVAWNIIFILTAISAIMFWNKAKEGERFLFFFKKQNPEFNFVIGLFIANAILNIGWSLLFFVLHYMKASVFEMMVLELTTILLIGLTWKSSKEASVLLVPYAAWVGFATYLAYNISILN